MINSSQYLSKLYNFVSAHPSEVLLALSGNKFEDERHQTIIKLLQEKLKGLPHLAGDVVLDMHIPQSDELADAILLYRGLVFVINIDLTADRYHDDQVNRVRNIAIKLKTSHAPSRDKFIVPVLLATHAEPKPSNIDIAEDLVVNTMADNGDNLSDLVEHFSNQFKADEIDAQKWLYGA